MHLNHNNKNYVLIYSRYGFKMLVQSGDAPGPRNPEAGPRMPIMPEWDPGVPVDPTMATSVSDLRPPTARAR